MEILAAMFDCTSPANDGDAQLEVLAITLLIANEPTEWLKVYTPGTPDVSHECLLFPFQNRHISDAMHESTICLPWIA